MPEHRVWTLVARHPLHARDSDRRHARQAELEIDNPRDFRTLLIGMARQIASQHTNDHVDTWLKEWELEVYRYPDDLQPHRRFRFPDTRGAVA